MNLWDTTLGVLPPLAVDVRATDFEHDGRWLDWPVYGAGVLSREHGRHRHPQVTRHRPIEQELVLANRLDSANSFTVKAVDLHANQDLAWSRRRSLEDLAALWLISRIVRAHCTMVGCST